MEYKSIYFNMFRILLKKPMVKKYGIPKTKESFKKGKVLYREMIEKTEDIGKGNPMAGNIYMGYIFMAICRAGGFSAKEFHEITVDFMNRKIIRKIMGKIDLNREKDIKRLEEKIKRSCRWVEDNPQYKDSTWDFNFDKNLHKDGFYYYFTRCPMEKFARENGYLDLLPICCDIDYLNIEAVNGVLYREQTLASSGCMCDYWIVGNKVEKPL